MNIFKKYKISLYNEEEYRKLDKFIIITFREVGYYYDNYKDISNDFGYAALLNIDVRAYRTLMYLNIKCDKRYNNSVYMILNKEKAIRKKKLLMTLLLERYDTLDNIINKIDILLKK